MDQGGKLKMSCKYLRISWGKLLSLTCLPGGSGIPLRWDKRDINGSALLTPWLVVPRATPAHRYSPWFSPPLPVLLVLLHVSYLVSNAPITVSRHCSGALSQLDSCSSPWGRWKRDGFLEFYVEIRTAFGCGSNVSSVCGGGGIPVVEGKYMEIF